MNASPLDSACQAAIADLELRRVPEPTALFFLATGAGMLPANFRSGMRLPLGKVKGVPDAWHDVLLHAGEWGGTGVWLIEDTAGGGDQGVNRPLDEAPWVRAFPCWLAASAGASVCVHTSAGVALEDPVAGAAGREPLARGSLAFARDHI